MKASRKKRAALPSASHGEVIEITGAAQHNLRGIDVSIPKNRLVVVTGVSGSGKSSLAFDTLYAEGYRRYVASLSAYARQFMEQVEKPVFETIRGLSPAISIEQRTVVVNPRSTVGTVTEIYDFLRVLYARAGTPRCPSCGREVRAQNAAQMAEHVMALPAGTRFHVMAPVVRGRKGIYRKELARLREMGFVRARIDGKMTELEGDIRLDRMRAHDIDVVVDSLAAKPSASERVRDSLALALKLAGDAVVVHLPDAGEDKFFSTTMACPRCGVNLPEMSPRLFSFNSPRGQCTECQGLGARYEADPERMMRDPSLSIREGGLMAYAKTPSPSDLREAAAVLKPFVADVNTPVGKLPKKAWKALLHGACPPSSKGRDGGKFEGFLARVNGWFRNERWSEDSRMRWIGPLMKSVPCAACGGTRLRKEARAVRVEGVGLAELSAMSVGEALARVEAMRFEGNRALVAAPVVKEVAGRLRFLDDVGLAYLSLDRPTATLSGGEAQRVRLATQVGCRLRGVLYVLDEPTVGLHPRDNGRLLGSLRAMRDLGNTVVVVEHDEETMRAADWILDLGPGAGVHGGLVTAEGTPEDVAKGESSTGLYLSGRREIPLPKERLRPNGRWLVIEGARENNLKNIAARFPVGLLTAVTGVSGSGKSTLVLDVLHRAAAAALHGAGESPGAHRKISGLEHFKRVVAVDQAPIGRTPRSNPATYTGLLSVIRDLFAASPEARLRGWGKGRFSFNVKGGRCEACKGMGKRKIEMAFMPDQFVGCETCAGAGFNAETLGVLWKGASIADVLDMTVEEALAFFAHVPRARDILKTLDEAGLSYLRLGQTAATLSGGEAQRLRLARELGGSHHAERTRRGGGGRTLYLFDEPTVGLHFEDVRRLVELLFRLRDQGHTLVVIEHHMDVVKCADWILDMGPEGGAAGGRIVAEGAPEAAARSKESRTAPFLRRALGTTP